MRLGLKEARPGSIKLRLRDFVAASALAAIPDTFGHEAAVKDWGMLANDRFGDCVWAGAAHEHMVWCGEAGVCPVFNDTNVLKAYGAVTGFLAGDPSTDQGTDMDQAAAYRRKTGILDAKGHHHKIAAYVDLTPGHLQEFLYAAYWFGAVGIGIRFPNFAMDQFNAGHPWDVQRTNAKVEGGHYVPLVAHRGELEVVTWGKTQPMTPAFFEKYCDQGVAYLSTEILNGGKTPEGLNLQAIKEAFAGVTAQ